MNWLKHAFDLGQPGEEIPPEQKELVEKLCQEIVRRQLAVPALVFLEMSRPLNVLSAQALHFFSPVLGMFGRQPAGSEPPSTACTHETMAKFLERRDSISYLCDRLEELEKRRVAETPPESAKG